MFLINGHAGGALREKRIYDKMYQKSCLYEDLGIGHIGIHKMHRKETASCF